MDSQVLAARGSGGYRQYRIPALATTPSGRLIAVYDGRPDLDDLPGPIDLVMRTSDDGGTTWSTQAVLRKAQGVAGFGDASIVIDPSVGEHGRILVFHQATRLGGFFESPIGVDADDPTIAHIDVSQSEDDGATWTHRRVTAQLKDASTPGIFATSGAGGRITTGAHAGRLLQTFVLRRGGELLGAVGYSDDHGDTWQLGALIPGGNESAAIGLADGSVLVHSRCTPYRLAARSADGGRTLDALGPDEALPDPSDNGSLCSLSSGAVVCTHNHDRDLRRRTVVKRSFDGGRTWPEAVVLAPGSSAYSTACELPDGRIGVLYERNGYAEMVFARIDPNDFQPVGIALAPEADEHGCEFTVALRFARPARRFDASSSVVRTSARMPSADLSTFGAAVRKEVGDLGASANGSPLFTASQYDDLLGPVRPGLRPGDELRFAGRLHNAGPCALTDVTIECPRADFVLTRAVLDPGERIVFPDVRLEVTDDDERHGSLTAAFSWRARSMPPGSTTWVHIGGEHVERLSTVTGLPA